MVGDTWDYTNTTWCTEHCQKNKNSEIKVSRIYILSSVFSLFPLRGLGRLCYVFFKVHSIQYVVSEVTWLMTKKEDFFSVMHYKGSGDIKRNHT